MRRGFGIWAVILLILVAVGVGIGAYNWGVSEGLEQSGRAVETVRYYHGPGFFPFGLILFPLLIFGFFALMRGAFWGRHWGDHHHGSGRLEEYHRELHERESRGGSTSPGETGSA
jgi:hypothetical protein